MPETTPGTAPVQGVSTGRALLIGGGLAVAAGFVLTAPAVLGVSVLPPCPFRTLTGFDCPFCGGTRATRALLTGDVGTALDYNLLVPLLALSAVMVAGWWLLSRTTDSVSFQGARDVAASRITAIVVVVVLLGFWVVRNLPAFAYLNSSG